jgi:hypothetical protein
LTSKYDEILPLEAFVLVGWVTTPIADTTIFCRACFTIQLATNTAFPIQKYVIM